MTGHNWRAAVLVGWVAGVTTLAAADQRHECFDKDPGWDGHNNRATAHEPRPVRQDFGYSATSHAGGGIGEVGGFVTPDAEPAYYAKRIETKTLADAFSASGKLAVPKGGGNTLIGFFNVDTLKEWRTPNTIVIRINGRGDVFQVHFEYTTAKWRSGAGMLTAPAPAGGRLVERELPSGSGVHQWALAYDPKGNNGGGRITLIFDGETAVSDLAPGHKLDGATFNRFGLLNVMKSTDGGGELWLDDLVIHGAKQDFSQVPDWQSWNNRRAFMSENVRFRFNFGYSPSRYAGGKAAGEIGGLIFRGDCRSASQMAFYGDRLESLSLDRPLKAAGKAALRRGVSDSTVIFGFFHATHSVEVSPSQKHAIPKDFCGIAIEGPSREGFLFYPCYRFHGDGAEGRPGPRSPYIYPDGGQHDWTLDYDPAGNAGNGHIVVTLDGKADTLDLGPGHKAAGATFNRFGFVTTHIDGNAQIVYLDDIEYTWKQ